MLMLVLTSAAVCMMPSASADDPHYALDDDIAVSPSASNITVATGESFTIFLDVKNNFTNNLRVYVYGGQVSKFITLEFPEGHDLTVKPDEIESIPVTIIVDRYADAGDYSVSFDISINDPDRGKPISATASNIVSIDVHSTTNGTEMYNRFLGLWDNKLDEPLDGSWFPAVLSFIFIIAGGYLVSFVVYPYIKGLIKRGLKP